MINCKKYYTIFKFLCKNFKFHKIISKRSHVNMITGKGGFMKVENSSQLLDDTLDGIFLSPGIFFSVIFSYSKC